VAWLKISADMNSQFPQALRAAAPYINAHSGRIAVVHIPGDVALSDALKPLVYDLAVAHSLGLKLILVLGARPQIEARLQNRKHATPIIDGHRLTDALTLECAKEAVGQLRSEFEALLSTGLASTPMGGARIRVASGNLVTARPVGIVKGTDLQYTGELRRLDTHTIADHLSNGRIVLLPPLGYSPTGETFNLRSDDLAIATARAMGADKLILFVAREVASGELSLSAAPDDPDEAQSMALSAVKQGVTRVHILNAAQDGALLRELYTPDGSGLMVSAQPYDSLHQASIDDIGGLLQLIEPLEHQGIIVARSREQLELDVERFTVMARDETIIGCRALFPYPQDKCAELACIIVAPSYQHGGRASALLAHAEQAARAQGLSRIFVLTTQTAHWFIEHGFRHGELDELPDQRKAFYNYQRNSRVLIKELS
jgi:amino-acid N-acetyltransferase